MALSNSQYDLLMRIYEQRQLEDEQRLRRQRQEAYKRIPALQQTEEEISSVSVAKAKNLLDGDETALASAKETLAGLFTRKRQLLLDAGFPEDYLEPHYTCPDCRDTGYIGTEKCHCFKKAIIDLLYQQSNLQGILEEENFSTFRLEYYSSNHIDPLTGRSSLEAVKTALKTCRSFVDNFSSEFHNLLLYGDTGVGKSFLSHCIAKELIDASYSVIYFSAVQLFEHFAENTFGGKREEHSDGLAPIYECDLLIIDDLGTELTNAFTASQLFACINERILRRKATIISTNLALDDIKSIYSERIFSRLSSSYTMLRLTGDDIRIQKKLLNLGGTKDVTS